MIELTRKFLRATRFVPRGPQTDWLPIGDDHEVRFEYSTEEGSYRWMGSCTARFRAGSDEFLATVEGMTTCCPPYPNELRGGVRARLGDGTEVTIRRNHWRPQNHFRVIDIVGLGVEWRVRGKYFDVQMNDLKNGRLLAEKRLFRNPRIELPTDGQQAALLLGLACIRISHGTLQRYSRFLNSL